MNKSERLKAALIKALTEEPKRPYVDKNVQIVSAEDLPLPKPGAFDHGDRVPPEGHDAEVPGTGHPNLGFKGPWTPGELEFLEMHACDRAIMMSECPEEVPPRIRARLHRHEHIAHAPADNLARIFPH